jgi:hypothetical protein
MTHDIGTINSQRLLSFSMYLNRQKLTSTSFKLLLAFVIALYGVDCSAWLQRLRGIPTRLSFDPVVCAELHSRLLLKALNKIDMYVTAASCPGSCRRP